MSRNLEMRFSLLEGFIRCLKIQEYTCITLQNFRADRFVSERHMILNIQYILLYLEVVATASLKVVLNHLPGTHQEQTRQNV
jgi:hypothetical protein